MDAAPLCPTSNCGNSSVASLLALYTEAPASFTMTYCSGFFCSLINSVITCSDSLEAVPFPTLITDTLYLLTSFCSSCLASLTLFWGAVG